MDVRTTGDGALVSVRVRPRSRPGVHLDQDAVIVSVAAPPLEGRATEEARRLLAASLAVRPRTVTLRSGARSRDKVFHVLGLGGDEVRRRLLVALREEGARPPA